MHIAVGSAKNDGRGMLLACEQNCSDKFVVYLCTNCCEIREDSVNILIHSLFIVIVLKQCAYTLVVKEYKRNLPEETLIYIYIYMQRIYILISEPQFSMD